MKQQSTMTKPGGVAWWGQWLAPAATGGGTLTAGQRGRSAVRGDGFALTEWADTEWNDTQSAQLADPHSKECSQ